MCFPQECSQAPVVISQPALGELVLDIPFDSYSFSSVALALASDGSTVVPRVSWRLVRGGLDGGAPCWKRDGSDACGTNRNFGAGMQPDGSLNTNLLYPPWSMTPGGGALRLTGKTGALAWLSYPLPKVGRMTPLWSPMTVSAWFRADTTQKNMTVFSTIEAPLRDGHPTGAYAMAFSLVANGTTLRPSLCLVTRIVPLCSASGAVGVRRGEWTHAVATVDKLGNAILYVNGTVTVLIPALYDLSTLVDTSPTIGMHELFVIGADANLTNSFVGSVDQASAHGARVGGKGTRELTRLMTPRR
jgi:hypothetical protein